MEEGWKRKPPLTAGPGANGCRGKWEESECESHPLIHTLLESNLIQDVVKKKAEPKSALFLKACIALCLMFLSQ